MQIAKLRHDIQKNYVDPATLPDTSVEALTAELQQLRADWARAVAAGHRIDELLPLSPDAFMSKAQLGRLALEYAAERAWLARQAPGFF